MAQFTPEQSEYIESTTKITITILEDMVGSILSRGEAMQNTLMQIVEKHNSELMKELRSCIRACGEGYQVEPRPRGLYLED